MKRVWRAAIAAALFLAISVVPFAFGAAGGSKDRGRDWGDASGAPPPHGADFDDSFAGERARVAREREQRRTPEARKERARSRTAYHGATRSEALGLARREFPGFFGDTIWQGPKAPAGGKIVRYLNDHSFLVKQPDGKTFLTQSLGPVLAEDEDGDKAPIDTSLELAGNGFEPANTLAPAKLPAAADGATSLEHAGISFRVVDADASSEASVDEDKAFYPDALPDSDLTVAPVADGLEVLMQLRSQQSPDDSRLEFDLPAGASLRLTSDMPAVGPDPLPKPEQARAEIVAADGHPLATIQPPAAADADGVPVPASYRVEGNRLIVHVPHQGGDWHYPILVDPYVVDDYRWKETGGTIGSAWNQGWRYRMNGSTGFSAYDCSQLNCAPNGVLNGPGLYLSGSSGPYSGDGSAWTEWYWQARRHANIVRADWRGGGLTTSGDSCLYAYISGPTANSSPNRQNRCGNMTSASWYPVSCTDIWNPCSTGGAATDNQAVFGFYSRNYQPALSWAGFAGVYVSEWEPYKPRVRWLTESAWSVNNQTVWTPPSGWVDENYTHSFRAFTTDDNLGMNNAVFYIDELYAGAGGSFCNGSYSASCPNDYVLPDPGTNATPFSISAKPGLPTSLSEGSHHLKVVAHDIIDNTSDGGGNYEWDFRIDRTKPTVSVPSTSTVKPDAVLSSGQQTLTVNGNDTGAGGATNSGIARFRWWVDNVERAPSVRNCSSGACSTTFTLDTTSAGLTEGWHTIKVDAEDGVAHQSQQAQVFGVVVDRTNPTVSVTHQGLPSGWVESASIRTIVSGTDSPGSGMKRGEVAAAIGSRALDMSGCANTNASRCPPTGSVPIDYNASELPDGDNSLWARSYDAANRPSAATPFWHIKVDRSKPTVVLTDSLAAADGQQISDSAYNLHIHATDGNTTDSGASSGVKSVEVFLDGDSQFYDDQPCADRSCAMDRDWPLDGSQLSAGSHKIDVVATDQLDHEQTSTITVSKSCCLVAASSWGTVLPTQDARFGDVDGDGFSDMVLRDKVTGRIDVRISDGSQFGSATQWGTQSTAYSFVIADVTGDGIDDLVGRNSATGDLRVAASTGSAFPAGSSWGTWNLTDQLSFADIDGDDAADVVGYDSNSGAVRVGYSDEVSFEPAFQYTVWNTAYSVGFADVTGDDAADIVGRNSSTGDIRVGVSDAGTFGTPSSWGTAASSVDVAFDDVDGDGLADLISRDTSSGAVSVGSSSGTGFGAVAAWGTFAPGYPLGSADVTGDEKGDLLGVNTLTGDIASARSTAAVPAGDPSPEVALDDTVPVQDDLLDPSTPTGQVTAAAAPQGQHGKPRIAIESDNVLLYRDRRTLGLDYVRPDNGQFADPFGAEEPIAVQRINAMYGRLKQMGASVVRFQVFWGRHENRADSNDPSGYAGGAQYYWTKLDKAVDLARANGFDVELTFTGLAQASECQSIPPFGLVDVYNPNGRACTAGGQPNPTGVNPDATQYGTFVEAGVRHFTRSTTDNVTPAVRVSTFSFWNEPNLRGWLRGNATDESKRIVPTRLYRSLYLSAYAGYVNATKQVLNATGTEVQPKVNGTQEFIGELSNGKSVGRMVDGPKCMVEARSTPKCEYTPVEFLAATVKSTAGTPSGYMPADGASLHPYQHRVSPDQAPKGNTKEVGIGRLGVMNKGLEDMFKQGKLKTPDGTKRPGLFLTEYGLHNAPVNAKDTVGGKPATQRQRAKRNNYWHTERTRANWYGGTALKQVGKSSRGAFDRALGAKAKWMLLWQVIESQPKANAANKVYAEDYGIFASPQFAGHPDDITGTRLYGKASENNPDPKLYNHPQKRLAYCAIRQWVISKGYFGSTPDPAVMNACPRPGAWKGGD